MMKRLMKVLTGVLASVTILFGLAAQPVQAMEGYTVGVDANGQAVVYGPDGRTYTSSAYLEHLVTNFTATPGDGCVTLNWAFTGVQLSDGVVCVYATTEDVTKMDPDDVLMGMPEKLLVGDGAYYVDVMTASQGPLCTSYAYTGLTNGVTYYFAMITNNDGSNTVYTASAVPGTPVQAPAAQEPAVQEPAQEAQPAAQEPAVQEPAQEVQPATDNIDAIAEEVLHGKWGNGAERRAKLEAAGFNYSEVQKKVNEKVAARGTVSQETAASGSVEAAAAEVIRGKWGNGAERKAKLEAAGYNYSEVQNKVNELMR